MFFISTRRKQRLRHVQARLNRLDPEAEPLALTVPGSPLPRGNVIVFPGSFNPPTNAHLALLKQAQRFAHQQGSTHLYAAFSKRVVNKETVERPLLLDRIVLLQTILRRRLPRTGILLFNRGLYVEQAQAIRTSFPHVRRIFFLMGFDKIVQILDPRYYDDRDAALNELFSQAELLVAPRGNDGEEALASLVGEPQNKAFARYIHALPFSIHYRYVSSSQVREGGETEARDIPWEVRAFMRETRAYAPPLVRNGTEIDYYAERTKCLLNSLAAGPHGRR